ncbi:tyrosine-type recombinase/integrase [Streptomyces sioyaensis]|uniref:tyrosine-type recombinase/integrase n=1 Tax=Streptomyces sioyaensis TaxID=67364 RepID=UPI0033D6DEB3
MTDIEAVPAAPLTPAEAERTALLHQWAARHGVQAAERLAAAEDFADVVADAITPANTKDTYDKSWRVWQRFCTAQRFPESEGSRGALVAYATWLLREGQQTRREETPRGYAPASARLHLDATIVRLRRAGNPVSKDDAAEARTALEGLAVQLLKDGERRGRGQAVAADIDGLHAIASACDDTLIGRRDLALILTGFNYASRASEPAGLRNGDVAVQSRGLVVSVLTGKTKHSVRNAKIPYATDPAICPVRAWIAYRELLVAEHGQRHARPDDAAFHWIDRHGNLRYTVDEGGNERYGLGPDGITRAIKRISVRAGVPIHWTGHSLRSGLASTGRRKGKDAVAIADQGGWARHSKSMLLYMRRDDGWEDNAAAGLT